LNDVLLRRNNNVAFLSESEPSIIAIRTRKPRDYTRSWTMLYILCSLSLWKLAVCHMVVHYVICFGGQRKCDKDKNT